MRSLALTASLAVLPYLSASAQTEADWKLYSDSTMPMPEVTLHDFYLQSSIERQGERVRVWTKGINARAMGNVTLPKDGIDRAAKKLVLGYKPPLAQIKPLSKDATADVIGLEEIADEDLVSPEIKMFEEVDCEKQLVRTLNVIVTHGGKFGSSDKPSDWQRIPPESSTSYLSRVLCQKVR